jgi:signal transduction histidine kinase
MSKEIKGIIIVLAIIATIGVAVSFFISKAAGFVCLITVIAVLIVFWRFTLIRYHRIGQLSDYLRRLSRGHFDFDIRDNAEGELSVLKNEIYTLAVQLSEQAERLRKDKEGLKNILSDISHQLKTPLTSFAVMSELLENENLPPEKRQEFIEKQKKALSNMEWMVLQLLKMAQLDAGSINFNTEAIFASEIINDSVEVVQALLGLKKQQMLSPPDSSLQVICDRHWTKEALINILKNASEHTPSGGIIRIGYGENALMFWIAVTDSGNGIDKKDMPRLFERFYKNEKQSGVGLGLAFSQSILRGQNGDIEVSSNPGQGATFTLKFYK